MYASEATRYMLGVKHFYARLRACACAFVYMQQYNPPPPPLPSIVHVSVRPTADLVCFVDSLSAG